MCRPPGRNEVSLWNQERPSGAGTLNHRSGNLRYRHKTAAAKPLLSSRLLHVPFITSFSRNFLDQT